MVDCSVEKCGKPIVAKGYCDGHYYRQRKYGDPLAGPTTRGAPLQWLKDHAPHVGDDCLIWPFSVTGDGYGQVRVGDMPMLASRMMCALAHGDPAPGSQAAHSCGKGHEGCVNPQHLRWATPAANTADKIQHGTHHFGSMVNGSKLTESDVIQIRRRYAAGDVMQMHLADEYGVHKSNISAIITRKSWPHIA